MAVFVKNPVEMSKSLPPPTALALSARRLDMGHPQTIIPDICHFFFTHTFSGLKILHSKVRKFATKIASRQNSVNQYWEVKFTFIFLAATFDYEIMKQGTNVLFVCTGIVSFEVILFLHISESLSRPPRSSALLPFAKQLLPPGEGWPSRPNLGQPKRIQVP